MTLWLDHFMLIDPSYSIEHWWFLMTSSCQGSWSSVIIPDFAWEEHEEDGRETGGFLIGLHHIEGQLLDELRPQVIHDELRQRSTDAVGPKHAKQKEAMERRPWDPWNAWNAWNFKDDQVKISEESEEFLRNYMMTPFFSETLRWSVGGGIQRY